MTAIVRDTTGREKGVATYACVNGAWNTSPTLSLCGENLIQIFDSGGGLNLGLDEGDNFGSDAFFNGNLLIVSAYSDDDGGTNRGAVYIFEEEGNQWKQTHKISDHTTSTVAADRFTDTKTDVNLDNNDAFGDSVSLSGNLLAIGADWSDDNGGINNGNNNGAVYLFEKSGRRWRQVHKFSNHTNSGVSGTRFTTTQTDVDLDDDDQFGHSVSLSGNWLAVGARRDDDGGSGPNISNTNRGAVYLFQKQTDGTWRQKHKFSDHTTLTATASRFTTTKTDVNLDDNDSLGSSVFLSGNMLVSGASGGNGKGAVYLFEKQTGGTWRQAHKFFDHTTLTATASRFTTTKTDVNLDAGDSFGTSVSLSGDMLTVGAWQDDDGGTDRGAVYLFEKEGNKWEQKHKYSDHTTNTNDATRFTSKNTDVNLQDRDYFGSSHYLYGTKLFVSLQHAEDGGLNTGAMYIFTWQGDTR